MTSDSPSPSLESLALRYVADRTSRGRFHNDTPRKVTNILLNFAASVGPDLPANRLTRRHVETWASSLTVSPSTARNRISTVRAFCQWLAKDHVRSDPARDLEIPRLPRSIPRGMKSTSVSRLYTVLPDRRAELIISLMVQEGLRCMEVSSLQLGDVDFLDNLLFIRAGKGGHQRILPITRETRSAIDAYLATHPASHGPLIRGYVRNDPTRSTHLPMRPGTISKYVSDWMKEAGLKSFPKDGVSAHALRHTAATDMLRSGAHLRDVQAALGHSSLATTQRYLPTIVHDLRVAMEGREYKHKPAIATPESEAS